jgi:hypothetical protein
MTNAIENPDKPKFITLGMLLYQTAEVFPDQPGRTVFFGDLAAAIGAEGVYTWDRYGILRPYAPGTPEALAALDRIAEAADWENRLNMVDGPLEPQNEGGFVRRDDQRLEIFEPARLFGWPADKLPSFATDPKDVAVEKRRSPQAQGKMDATNRKVIGALVLRELGRTVKSPPTQGEINELAHALHKDIKGAPGETPLKARFVEALLEYGIRLDDNATTSERPLR